MSHGSEEHKSGCALSGRPPIKVVLTGAAGNIGYALAFMIAQGRMFETREVDLRLLDLPACASKLDAISMELQDCASQFLASVLATTDNEAAFTDADVCLLVGAMPRKGGMERSELLTRNAAIFQAQGRLIEKFASRDVRVCVVGNPANTNALITMVHAPSIPRRNFTALTRLDQNRAEAMLAARLGVSVSRVGPAIIWGNHSSTQYPDTRSTRVTLPDGSKVGVAEALVAAGEFANAADAAAWLNGPFIKAIQQRGAAVIKKRGASSAGSAANAIASHVRDWMCGTDGRVVSMGVYSDGTAYDVPKGLICSMPVTIDAAGHITIARDHDMTTDADAAARFTATVQELAKECAIATGSAVSSL